MIPGVSGVVQAVLQYGALGLLGAFMYISQRAAAQQTATVIGRLLDVVSQNTAAQTKMADAIASMAAAIERNTEAIGRGVGPKV